MSYVLSIFCLRSLANDSKLPCHQLLKDFSTPNNFCIRYDISVLENIHSCASNLTYLISRKELLSLPMTLVKTLNPHKI